MQYVNLPTARSSISVPNHSILAMTTCWMSRLPHRLSIYMSNYYPYSSIRLPLRSTFQHPSLHTLHISQTAMNLQSEVASPSPPLGVGSFLFEASSVPRESPLSLEHLPENLYSKDGPNNFHTPRSWDTEVSRSA